MVIFNSHGLHSKLNGETKTSIVQFRLEVVEELFSTVVLSNYLRG